ncbi:MAG: dienelactone hydrolase family protein [Thermoanaerobaculia bacterium]|nr:dienelactone hydrolase family protein [Thermoanaerobaculia bacterium]
MPDSTVVQWLGRSVLVALMVTIGLGSPLQAEVQTETREYQVGDTTLRGLIAWDSSVEGKRPGVLVVHEWWGHNDYAQQRAKQLAAEGFTAFALDMYGAGKVSEHPDDARKFMMALLSDLAVAEQRFNAGLQVLKEHPSVDAERTAAIGYCLGGSLALYMGRQGADLDAVFSFHGSLQLVTQAEGEASGDALPAMFVFTGGADPMIPGDQVSEFLGAMLKVQAEVHVTSYPQAQHSFTVPEATERGQKLGMPFAYDAEADADSWRRTLDFLRHRLASR